MVQRGGKGQAGKSGQKRKIVGGERTVSAIKTDKSGSSAPQKPKLRGAKLKWARKGAITSSTAAAYAKARGQGPKDSTREPKKNQQSITILDIVRSMVRPYRVSRAKSLRTPKMRMTTPRTRTLFYADSPGFDRNRIHQSVDHEISVVVYLDTNDETQIQNVLARVDELQRLAGYTDEYDVTVERGSIFRKARAAIGRGLSHREVGDRLTKLERAVEIAYLDSKQAEIDSTEAGAVQQLIESVQEINRACIRSGSILMIKFLAAGESVVLVRNLSQVEIRALERFPEIQTKPEIALSALATAVESMEHIEVTHSRGGIEIAGAGSGEDV